MREERWRKTKVRTPTSTVFVSYSVVVFPFDPFTSRSQTLCKTSRNNFHQLLIGFQSLWKGALHEEAWEGRRVTRVREREKKKEWERRGKKEREGERGRVGERERERESRGGGGKLNNTKAQGDTNEGNTKRGCAKEGQPTKVKLDWSWSGAPPRRGTQFLQLLNPPLIAFDSEKKWVK